MRRIKYTLSTRSIERAVKELREYKEEIRQKALLIVGRLAEIGWETAINPGAQMGDSDFDSVSVMMDSSTNGSISRATVTMQGKDVFFIEFGAGVHYNGGVGSSMSGINDELHLGFTIGSYGQGFGENDWWLYKDENGVWQKSYGTQATAQMDKANKKIRENVINVVREVFNDAH